SWPECGPRRKRRWAWWWRMRTCEARIRTAPPLRFVCPRIAARSASEGPVDPLRNRTLARASGCHPRNLAENRFHSAIVSLDPITPAFHESRPDRCGEFVARQGEGAEGERCCQQRFRAGDIDAIRSQIEADEPPQVRRSGQDDG